MAWNDFFSQFNPIINSFVYMLNRVIKIFFDIKIFGVPIIIYPIFFGLIILIVYKIFGVDVDD